MDTKIDRNSIQFNWSVLQVGRSPLRPDGMVVPLTEHRCTSALVWYESEVSWRDRTLVIDPCWRGIGCHSALRHLDEIGLRVEDIGYYFITHAHHDHKIMVPCFEGEPQWNNFVSGTDGFFKEVKIDSIPGHSPDSKAIFFNSTDGLVCIAGDTILDLEWLKAWQPYWPNHYKESEVIETWRSIAAILSQADVVVPGHGKPFRISQPLLVDLLNGFTKTRYSNLCRDVASVIEQRVQWLSVSTQ